MLNGKEGISLLQIHKVCPTLSIVRFPITKCLSSTARIAWARNIPWILPQFQVQAAQHSYLRQISVKKTESATGPNPKCCQNHWPIPKASGQLLGSSLVQSSNDQTSLVEVFQLPLQRLLSATTLPSLRHSK